MHEDPMKSISADISRMYARECQENKILIKLLNKALPWIQAARPGPNEFQESKDAWLKVITAVEIAVKHGGRR